MKIKVIKYVLMVENMERAVLFYRDVMGLDMKFKSPEWSELVFGESVIGLHSGGASEKKFTGLSFQVSNIKEAFDEAINGGAIKIEMPSARDGEPIILATVADPENNIITLTEYVS